MAAPGIDGRVAPEELPRSTLVLVIELGRGEFGTVHKGLYKPPSWPLRQTSVTRRTSMTSFLDPMSRSLGVAVSPATFEYPVAIKSLKETPGQQARDAFMREAAITAQFDHPNVVGLIGVVTKNDPVLLVLQYCERGALDAVVLRAKLPHDQLAVFAMHIASGMEYLLSRRFVHRDLACRNVLVDTRSRAKVADFGLSRNIYDRACYTSTDASARLPLRWMSPEVFQSQKFGEASDIWAYGVTLVELYSQAATPYSEWSNILVLERIKDGYVLPRPADCPAVIYDDVIAPCFWKEPRDRPSFRALRTRLGTLLDSPLLQLESPLFELDSPVPDAMSPSQTTGGSDGRVSVSALAELSAAMRAALTAASHPAPP